MVAFEELVPLRTRGDVGELGRRRVADTAPFCATPTAYPRRVVLGPGQMDSNRGRPPPLGGLGRRRARTPGYRSSWVPWLDHNCWPLAALVLHRNGAREGRQLGRRKLLQLETDVLL